MRFLVTSYDDDQQQWFYDTVEAKTADAAETYVCAARPYVLDSDALPIEAVEKLAQTMRANLTKSTSECDVWDASDPLTECQDCETRTPESKLNPVKDLHQRVEPGEPMPAGECPECGALCQEIEAQS